MASMNYFDSKRKNPTYVLKQKSVMERHVITKSTNIHDYSCFCLFLLCVCLFVCFFFAFVFVFALLVLVFIVCLFFVGFCCLLYVLFLFYFDKLANKLKTF
jgi:hypothetical protein